ncbi:MAG: helix-turn-helix domain-containing protein [Saprospiraceae bacterium]
MKEVILRPISNDSDYEHYLKWANIIMDKKVKKDTLEGEVLQVVLILIKDYEDKNYPIPFIDPIDAIKLKLIELGYKDKDLSKIIGSKGYISNILNKRKPLTLNIAKKLHKELGISADLLLS